MGLKFYKNLHKGKTAVIIAGGPSLKRTNLEIFDKGVYRLGVSLVYRGVEDIDYQFIGDRNIFTQVYRDFIMGHEFQQLFVSQGIYHQFRNLINTKNVSYFTGGEKKFYTDVSKGTYGGGTSSFLAMQFAYYMGFDPVFIVGLDHSWDFSTSKEVGEGVGGKLLRHTGEDVNHFTNDFYGDKINFFKPKEDKMLESYAMAGKAYAEAGRNLINVSIETKVPNEVIRRASPSFLKLLEK